MILNDCVKCRFEFPYVAGRKKRPRLIGKIRKLNRELLDHRLCGRSLEIRARGVAAGQRTAMRRICGSHSQFIAFAHDFNGQISHAGRIAARLGPALRELAVDGIAAAVRTS